MYGDAKGKYLINKIAMPHAEFGFITFLFIYLIIYLQVLYSAMPFTCSWRFTILTFNYDA